MLMLTTAIIFGCAGHHVGNSPCAWKLFVACGNDATSQGADTYHRPATSCLGEGRLSYAETSWHFLSFLEKPLRGRVGKAVIFLKINLAFEGKTNHFIASGTDY